MSSDPNNEDEFLGGEIDEILDQQDIPDQVASFVDYVEEAQAKLFLAHQLAMRIGNAISAGVLEHKEGEQFARAVIERVKDLQAMLVLQWSGASSDRETIEQLHHIYYPRRRPDGGLALTLDDHLYAFRKNIAFEFLVEGAREGPETKYWELLREYVAKNPNEPLGWQKALERPKKVVKKKKNAKQGKSTKSKTTKSTKREGKKGKG